jgi:hypothetical protein
MNGQATTEGRSPDDDRSGENQSGSDSVEVLSSMHSPRAVISR